MKVNITIDSGIIFNLLITEGIAEITGLEGDSLEVVALYKGQFGWDEYLREMEYNKDFWSIRSATLLKDGNRVEVLDLCEAMVRDQLWRAHTDLISANEGIE